MLGFVAAILPGVAGAFYPAYRAADGVLIAFPETGAHVGREFVVERWSRPWKEGRREPIPAAWRVATQPDWQNDTSLVCHFGLNSPVTRDRSLLAAMVHPTQRAPQSRILTLPAGQEVVGGLFLLYALAIYPLLGWLSGHTYPRSPSFGLTPCPVTIFSVGLLLWTTGRVPKYLLVIPNILNI